MSPRRPKDGPAERPRGAGELRWAAGQLLRFSGWGLNLLAINLSAKGGCGGEDMMPEKAHRRAHVFPKRLFRPHEIQQRVRRDRPVTRAGQLPEHCPSWTRLTPSCA